MKLNQVKVEVFEEDSAVGLQAAITTFLNAGGEKVLVSVHYSIAVGVHGALICYST